MSNYRRVWIASPWSDGAPPKTFEVSWCGVCDSEIIQLQYGISLKFLWLNVI